MIPPVKSKAKLGIIEMLRKQGMPGGPMNMGEEESEDKYLEDLSEEELAALSPEERKRLRRRADSRPNAPL
jgi:hypothetical protein